VFFADHGAKRRVRHALVAPILRHAFHAWSGNTAHAAATAAQRYGLKDVAVTYNALDGRWLAGTRDRSETRRELGLASDSGSRASSWRTARR
jgi:hypothetical protein